jgi:hypothetical protein
MDFFLSQQVSISIIGLNTTNLGEAFKIRILLDFIFSELLCFLDVKIYFNKISYESSSSQIYEAQRSSEKLHRMKV